MYVWPRKHFEDCTLSTKLNLPPNVFRRHCFAKVL